MRTVSGRDTTSARRGLDKNGELTFRPIKSNTA